MRLYHHKYPKNLILLLVGQEESVGPIDIVQKNFAFIEHVHNSYLIDIFYHFDSCCHEVEL